MSRHNLHGDLPKLHSNPQFSLLTRPSMMAREHLHIAHIRLDIRHRNSLSLFRRSHATGSQLSCLDVILLAFCGNTCLRAAHVQWTGIVSWYAVLSTFRLCIAIRETDVAAAVGMNSESALVFDC